MLVVENYFNRKKMSLNRLILTNTAESEKKLKPLNHWGIKLQFQMTIFYKKKFSKRVEKPKIPYKFWFIKSFLLNLSLILPFYALLQICSLILVCCHFQRCLSSFNYYRNSTFWGIQAVFVICSFEVLVYDYLQIGKQYKYKKGNKQFYPKLHFYHSSEWCGKTVFEKDVF